MIYRLFFKNDPLKIVKIISFILLIAIISNMTCETVSASKLLETGLADTPQPKYRHDINNTGRSPYLGPQTNSTVWKFKTGAPVMSGPVIGADGTIYVGSSDYNLYAINADGTKKWSFKTGNTIKSTPIIGADGTIYFGSYDHYFYALTPDGKMKWKYDTTNGYSSPAIAPDGTIYIGSFDNNLYALNPNGTLKWKFLTGSHIMSSPAIGMDGIIYFGSNDNNLYALNPNGTVKWSYKTDDLVASSATIGPDGSIYFGSRDTYFYALTTDGILKWKYKTDNWAGSSALGNDGSLYFKCEDGYFYALDSQGNLKWKYYNGMELHSTPVIGSDGTIYFGGNDSYFYAFNPDGTIKWSYNTDRWIGSSPAIGSNGNIYFGCDDTYVYAVGLAAFAKPKGGHYKPTQYIRLSMNEPGTIYYTIDGTDPSTSSNIYSKPIVLDKTGKKVIKFMGVNLLGHQTSIYTENYILETIPPKLINISTISTTKKYIKVTFNEDIKNGTGWIELKTRNGTALSYKKYIEGNSIFITPTKTLATGTYLILLHTGCITDLAGNKLAPHSGRFQVDKKIPTVLKIDPLNWTLIYDAKKVIKVTFSESVKNGTGWIELRRNGVNVSFNKTISGNMLTIKPSTLLKGIYTIILHTGCLTDRAGNKLAGYNSKFIFR